VNSPPTPLTEEDIWFQIGHVYEQQKDVSLNSLDAIVFSDADHLQFDNAKTAYLRVLDRDPKHAKVLQQLGWLHHQQSSSFSSQERAIDYLEKSVDAGKLRPANTVPSTPSSNTWQTTMTRKAGTSLADVTCHSRSTPRHMRLISRLCTAMAGTLHSGARLACCIIRSTNTAMPWMRIREPFV
jgi:hypothetical protein